MWVVPDRSGRKMFGDADVVCYDLVGVWRGSLADSQRTRGSSEGQGAVRLDIDVLSLPLVIPNAICRKPMQTATLTWNPDSICLYPSTLDVRAIAADIYDRTCRTSFDAPGFCVVNVGDSWDSVAFRQLMVNIKREMAASHISRSKQTLIYLSAGRFDQQESTKPHLDGGPDECFLMLGYEPSEIPSELEISDYTKCAYELGLTPKQFMAKHNPMFKSGHDLLRPYSTRIPCFSANTFQIVCINNSSAPHVADGSHWQGTLHTATIQKPDESKRRVINSTMIARAPLGSSDVIDEKSLQYFIHTSEVKRRGYDKPHLDDDK